MRSALLVLLLAACGGKLPPPQLLPTTQGARWFVGVWQGRSRAASGKETTLRWAVTPSLGGAWLEGRSRAAELGVEARDFLGPSGGGLVRVYVDSQGTRVTMTSAGWEGRVLHWTGEGFTVAGEALKVREEVQRVDDDTLHAVWEVWADDAWAPLSEETLHRVK